MIKRFASKETEQVFKRIYSRKLPQDIQRNARRKLEVLGLNFDPEKKKLEKKERELSNSLYNNEDPVLPLLPLTTLTP